jgi:hypothetical protein
MFARQEPLTAERAENAEIDSLMRVTTVTAHHEEVDVHEAREDIS